jgi:hypothetical protein
VEGRVGALEELVPLVRFTPLPAKARLRMDSEPLLLALGKLDVPKLDSSTTATRICARVQEFGCRMQH